MELTRAVRDTGEVVSMEGRRLQEARHALIHRAARLLYKIEQQHISSATVDFAASAVLEMAALHAGEFRFVPALAYQRQPAMHPCLCSAPHGGDGSAGQVCQPDGGIRDAWVPKGVIPRTCTAVCCSTST